MKKSRAELGLSLMSNIFLIIEDNFVDMSFSSFRSICFDSVQSQSMHG